MLYPIDYIAYGLHLWYDFLVLKDMCRKPTSQRPHLGPILIHHSERDHKGCFIHAIYQAADWLMLTHRNAVHGDYITPFVVCDLVRIDTIQFCFAVV